MRPPRYAVIPTNGRPCHLDAVEAIRTQVDDVFLIWTDSEERVGPVKEHVWYRYPELDGINISHWWNIGLHVVAFAVGIQTDRRFRKWDVAIINDDVIVPEGWFDAVAGKMRELRAVAACSGGTTGVPILHTHSGPIPLDQRMQGFAFILAGESGLRADEQFEWWAGDDDLGWRAAGAGGMVMIPGFHVQHLFPDGQVTPAMQATMAADMQRFVDKWGQRPW